MMSHTISKIWPNRTSVYGRFVHFLYGVSLGTHVLIAILNRCVLIAYSQVQDARAKVPFTDVDYKVVTDGARYMLQGRSPFDRHTYRYSPLMALLQIPNVLLHPQCGKIVYAAFDILVGVLIYRLVNGELRSQCDKAVKSLLSKYGGKLLSSQRNYNAVDERRHPEKIALASACFWLYNPLVAVISTRGNGDSFSSFFVILTIYLLLRSETSQRRRNHCLVFVAGLTHGFVIHLRLYPLLFSLAYFLCLSNRLMRCPGDFVKQLFFPSVQQIAFVAGTLIGFCSITGCCYQLYGWRFIFETYLFHFVRKDFRHNFSLYFLMQYLGCDSSSSSSIFYIDKFLVATPQFILILYLSVSFGQFRQTLPFCVFTLAFVIVTFNSVITSQYFIWYLAILPLCLNNLQSLSMRKALAYFVLWLLAQGLWLLPAYLLEFRTWNTFYWIGAQGFLFFLVNNFLLTSFIEHYSFTSFKINFKKLF